MMVQVTIVQCYDLHTQEVLFNLTKLTLHCCCLPVGTFSNATGLRSSDECYNCTGGSYCATTGLTQPTGLCGPGYYCEERSVAMEPVTSFCPIGSYCPEGVAQPIPCQNNSYVSLVLFCLVLSCLALSCCVVLSNLDLSCPWPVINCPVLWGILINFYGVKRSKFCPHSIFCHGMLHPI